MQPSIKTLAQAKGKTLRYEEKKKYGTGSGKIAVAEDELDKMAESLSIQMAKVAGLIMPPHPP